jgi:hypothetical protein
LVLGWILDSVAKTITLPLHCVDRLQALLQSLPWSKSGVSTKTWHKVLGELRSVTLGLPGASGLFRTLRETLHHPSQRRIHLTLAVHDFMDEFQALASTLSSRPTRIAELLPQPPSTIGSSDASGVGLDSVHFIPLPDGTIQPILWHQPLPSNIDANLITNDNPSGTITMNDFELAASVAHHDVLAQYDNILSLTTHNFHDNTTAVYWKCKRSATTMKAAAYLLRLEALHQRFHQYVPAMTICWGPSIPWSMTVLICGIFRTHNCWLTLLLNFHRSFVGKYSACAHSSAMAPPA